MKVLKRHATITLAMVTSLWKQTVYSSGKIQIEIRAVTKEKQRVVCFVV
jgi:hypothetical protein